MIITNELNLPQALVDAVTTEKHNEEGCVSATTLLKGVRAILLTDRHWDEITVDVKDRLWALWGTVAHALLEKEYADTFTEEVVSEQVGDMTVTGKFDCYDMKQEVLFDYKTTSVWKIVFQNFADWKQQGYIYAWLLSKKGVNVKECRFVAMLRDWSETESKRKADYPKSPIYEFSFPVFPSDLEDVEKVINLKVKQITDNLDTPDDELPLCDIDERWTEPTKYAVMKEGRKSAVKVFEDINEADALAEELGAKHYVETRLGRDKRCCKKYCECCQFCEYYRRFYAEEEQSIAGQT